MAVSDVFDVPERPLRRSRRRLQTPAIPGMLSRMPPKRNLPGLAEAPPHYHGHRERLRARFSRSRRATALADYEMLELVLFRAIPQRDVKPLAKALLAPVRLVRRSDLGAAPSG